MIEEQYSTEKIICPYCKTERDIDWEVDVDEEQVEEKCNNCGKAFFIHSTQSWSWTTVADCKLNDEQHSFPTKEELSAGIGVRYNRNIKYCLCRECGKIELLD